MKNSRYNIFDFIHKAWRALLYETALVLQQTDFDNTEEAEKALKQLELVLDTFAKHAYHEDHFVIPAIQKYAKATAFQMQDDHGKDEMLTHQLNNKIEAFRFTPSQDLKNELGREIMYLFIEFVAFNLVHMNMEEHTINELLWKHYSDAELIQINDSIVKSIPPEEMMFSIQWMIKGISNMQLALLLNKIKGEVPVEVFESVCSVAQNSLTEARWDNVKKQVFEPVELN